MTNFNFLFLFLLIFYTKHSITQIPPVVPLTNALTAVYCHNSDESGIMTIRCGPNEKIRMLDAFDVVVKNKSHLPLPCVKQKRFSMLHDDNSNNADCKVHTSFTSACSGRENCTLHMQRIRLKSANDNCHNELVDYTMAFFECISDVFIHDVCSSQAITSAWGTLQTPNFPNPYTSSDDCWCKLSTQLQHRLLLSVISFQLIPYDQQCAGAGLYLQSSDEQQSTQCTYLQQGHNYLSDSNSLYINFYSRTPTVRGGFWIIYEASHPNAEVHLHCGPREKIGVPSRTTLSPPISSSHNHGWSRLAFNNPPNPTASMHDRMLYMRLSSTTPRLFLDKNYKVNPSTISDGAFTYPHGRLSTFELAYGPRGWFVKSPFGSSNMTATKFLQTTTSEMPVVKWNSTWRYTRQPRTKMFRTTATTRATTTTIPITTTFIPPTTTTESTTTITSTSTSTIITTGPNTIALSSTTTNRTVTVQSRLLFSHNPWIYHSSSNTESSTTTPTPTTIKPTIKSTVHLPASSFMLKTTLPSPTPWYPPAGPFDWWQWQWYTTKFKTVSSRIFTTTHEPASSTQTTTTTTTIAATSTTTRSTSSSSTKTSRITTVSKYVTTVDWFKWPNTESTTNTKGRPDYYEDEYPDWPDYFATNKIQVLTTSKIMINPLVTFPPQQQLSQQMSFLPTKSNWHKNDRVITINTPPSKRHRTQQNTGAIGERNAVGIQSNEEVTNSNAQNSIQYAIEQRNKKTFIQDGWLSKTDITIVAVSILFVILLVIVNLLLFAARRHRHRLQGRHLLSASLPSSLNGRRIALNDHLQDPTFSNSTNNLINTTNNNNNDILPAVGEIVIWDEKDQGGYMIDNEGEWAKIEGRQWFGGNLLKSFNKTSFSKSFRSRFRFIRQSDKKLNHRHQQAPSTPKTQQQTFKSPLLMDTTSLSPVPEADDYQSSELSLSDIVIRSSATTRNHSTKRHPHQSERKQDLQPSQAKKVVQALIHKEQEQSDEYYKRIEIGGDESNYTSMQENAPGEYSIGDRETDRSLGNEIKAGGSVVVSVPTMLRREDDADSATDAADSIYNQNYSIQSLIEYPNKATRRNYLQPNNKGPLAAKQSTSTFKPSTNNSIIVGYCQADLQPLDPKLLIKSTDKSLLAEHQQFYRYSQSLQLSLCDSGFIDDQTADSLAMERKDEHRSMDSICFSKTEDDNNLPLNDLSTTELRNTNRQKRKHITKQVSFLH